LETGRNSPQSHVIYLGLLNSFMMS